MAKVEKFLGMAPPIASTAVHPQQQQITQPLFRKVLLSTRVETNLNRTRKWFKIHIDFDCLRLLNVELKRYDDFFARNLKNVSTRSQLYQSKYSLSILQKFAFWKKKWIFSCFHSKYISALKADFHK